MTLGHHPNLHHNSPVTLVENIDSYAENKQETKVGDKETKAYTFLPVQSIIREKSVEDRQPETGKRQREAGMDV